MNPTTTIPIIAPHPPYSNETFTEHILVDDNEIRNQINQYKFTMITTNIRSLTKNIDQLRDLQWWKKQIRKTQVLGVKWPFLRGRGS